MSAQDDDTDDDDSDDKPVADNSPFEKNYYVFSFRASVQVPHPMANKAFRKSFVGVYQAGGEFDVMVYKGIFIGGVYETMGMKITGNKIRNYNASMEVQNAAGKVGGDFFIGERNRVVISGALVVGQSWTTYFGLATYDNRPPPAYTSFSCTYEQPSVNLYFLADRNFGIGATLSYTVYNHIFNSYELRLNDWGLPDYGTSGSTQAISFGFTFYYNLWKKKEN
jgi:hypothetical protein